MSRNDSTWVDKIMSEMVETNFDELKRKDYLFMADWLKTKGLRKLCSVFENV